MIAYEVSLGIILLNVALCTGTFNLIEIITYQDNIWLAFPLLPAMLLFTLTLFAETARPPFDLPEAEGELVAGYNVEYSAVGFTLFFIAEYTNILLISALLVSCFLGGWSQGFGFVTNIIMLDMIPITRITDRITRMIPECIECREFVATLRKYVHANGWQEKIQTFVPILGMWSQLSVPPSAIFAIKLDVVVIAVIWVRATVPRYRYDQLMRLGWKVCLPLALGTLVLTYSLLYALDAFPRRF